MELQLGVVFLLIGGSFADQKMRYDNYTLYRLIPKSEEAIKVLKLMENDFAAGYNFWTSANRVGDFADVVIPPFLKTNFQNIIFTQNIDVSVMMEDIQEVIDEETIKSNVKTGGFGWTKYNTLDEIYEWLRSLPQKYPNVVSLIDIGRTYEGRPILGVKVSYNKGNDKEAVFLESNIHAREWITSATNTYILNQLLTSKDSRIRHIAESHDWYIIPVANPDGFVYSHTTQRLWRKTRVPHTRLCYGSDPNRNFAYRWNEGGSSSFACSETYSGPQPFSDNCTKALSDFITSIADKLVVYISIHSYMQLLMLPYGHTVAHLDNYNQTFPIGVKAIQSLAQRYGTQYKVGNIAETIYVATGSSADWVKGTFQTPVVFTYELRDTGRYGFLLPPEQIVPTSVETLDSLVTILNEAKQAQLY